MEHLNTFDWFAFPFLVFNLGFQIPSRRPRFRKRHMEVLDFINISICVVSIVVSLSLMAHVSGVVDLGIQGSKVYLPQFLIAAGLCLSNHAFSKSLKDNK